MPNTTTLRSSIHRVSMAIVFGPVLFMVSAFVLSPTEKYIATSQTKNK